MKCKNAIGNRVRSKRMSKSAKSWDRKSDCLPKHLLLTPLVRIVVWSIQHLSFWYFHAVSPQIIFPVGKQLREEIMHNLCKIIDTRNLIRSLRWALLVRQVYLEIL